MKASAKKRTKAAARIIVCIGVPGAGKSTFVRRYCERMGGVYVISTDEIRKELTGTCVCDPSMNKKVHDEAVHRAKELLEGYCDGTVNPCAGLGLEIIIDATNATTDDWVAYQSLQPGFLFAWLFDIDPEIAWFRIQKRGGYQAETLTKEVVMEKHKSIHDSFDKMREIFDLVFNQPTGVLNERPTNGFGPPPQYDGLKQI